MHLSNPLARLTRLQVLPSIIHYIPTCLTPPLFLFHIYAFNIYYTSTMLPAHTIFSFITPATHAKHGNRDAVLRHAHTTEA
mmetsp:Transcript_5509/g.12633  ORF Transcript_5509/g.12633 Transcript_5509/m.12633 type:complete len:81 (+) Transcript_5509:3111-3353(+)